MNLGFNAVACALDAAIDADHQTENENLRLSSGYQRSAPRQLQAEDGSSSAWVIILAGGVTVDHGDHHVARPGDARGRYEHVVAANPASIIDSPLMTKLKTSSRRPP